jgi:hypothetical protein
MGRGPCHLRQGDVTRAVRAVTAAGLSVARVEVYADGKFVVVPGTPVAEDQAARQINEWDTT